MHHQYSFKLFLLYNQSLAVNTIINIYYSILIKIFILFLSMLNKQNLNNSLYYDLFVQSLLTFYLKVNKFLNGIFNLEGCKKYKMFTRYER
jgi:hypothetical protein